MPSFSFIKKIFSLSREISLAMALGAFCGLGLFVFSYGEGQSYLSNHPESCTNCHVMQDSYDSWQKSSHHHVATCNDCHLSHHPVGKWVTKMDNGLFHSYAFAFDDYHKPIQIKARNKTVVQDACLHCHTTTAHQIGIFKSLPKKEQMNCTKCHSQAGHAHHP